MTGNFNIRDSIWNNLYFFHLIYSDTIFDIADSFDIFLSSSLQQTSMQYLDNNQITNLTIISQISYSLVVMLELNGVLEVQYKEIMIISNE